MTMRRLATPTAAVALLALGVLIGVVVGHSADPRTSTVTVAGAVTTVRVSAASPARTVTHVVVHTHAVTTPAPTAPAPTATEPTSTASTNCNNLPASASTNLAEIRESRCEMENLNAENPSAAKEHEIETMITSERAIEASE
jgi:hypothetical protein